jgi:hypothetical protein
VRQQRYRDQPRAKTGDAADKVRQQDDQAGKEQRFGCDGGMPRNKKLNAKTPRRKGIN